MRRHDLGELLLDRGHGLLRQIRPSQHAADRPGEFRPRSAVLGDVGGVRDGGRDPRQRRVVSLQDAAQRGQDEARTQCGDLLELQPVAQPEHLRLGDAGVPDGEREFAGGRIGAG